MFDGWVMTPSHSMQACSSVHAIVSGPVSIGRSPRRSMNADAGGAIRGDCNLTLKRSHDFPFRGVGTASVSKSLEMGPPTSVVECASVHIGGAKSIRVDD